MDQNLRVLQTKLAQRKAYRYFLSMKENEALITLRYLMREEERADRVIDALEDAIERYCAHV